MKKIRIFEVNTAVFHRLRLTVYRLFQRTKTCAYMQVNLIYAYMLSQYVSQILQNFNSIPQFSKI